MGIRRITASLLIPILAAGISSAAFGEDTPNDAPYAYATNGVTDHILGRSGSEWKLLLDGSNLGGKELEMVELTLPPGTVVGSHTHTALEVIYVLSGTYDHEVNGKLYRLTPGMVGIVRPGDHVRHLVPKTDATKVLIIWAPAGEAERVLGRAKGDPVAALKAIDTASTQP